MMAFTSLSDNYEQRSKSANYMDLWLEDEGFYRKHIARDPSSLFRCVSEIVFLTQTHHLVVRRHCIQFAKYHLELFRKLTNIPVQDYIERLSNSKEWGTQLDMNVMSLIYKLDFAVYKEVGKPLEKITSNGFKCCIFLSLSHEHHYDSVYPRIHINNTALCQAVFYEILYKDVFQLEEVDYAVEKMLPRDRSHQSLVQNDQNIAYYSPGFQMRLEMRDNWRNVRQLLDCGITPFPYKVAKSLDPSIYRNVEYDTWSEQRKGLRSTSIVWNNKELRIGARCIVNFLENDKTIKRHGYIQDMAPNQGPVLVYVEELAERQSVPFDALELIHVHSNHGNDGEEFYEHLSEGKTEEQIEYNGKSENRESLAASPTNVNESILSNSTTDDMSMQLPIFITPLNCGPVLPSNCQPVVNNCSGLCATAHVTSNSFFRHSNKNKSTTQVNGSNCVPMYTSYSAPVYPSIMSSDLNVPPPIVNSTLTNIKTEIIAECQDNPSHRRGHNNLEGEIEETCMGYGYPASPYHVPPLDVVYPVQPTNVIQSSSDLTRVTYSYPIPQMTNEIFYSLPANTSISNKNDVSLYPVHPSPAHKKTKLANEKTFSPVKGVNLQNLPSSAHLMPPNVYPLTYPPYFYAYDYCLSYPEIGKCESLPPTYQISQLLPVAFADGVYSPSSLCCQSCYQ